MKKFSIFGLAGESYLILLRTLRSHQAAPSGFWNWCGFSPAASTAELGGTQFLLDYGASVFIFIFNLLNLLLFFDILINVSLSPYLCGPRKFCHCIAFFFLQMLSCVTSPAEQPECLLELWNFLPNNNVDVWFFAVLAVPFHCESLSKGETCVKGLVVF